MGTGRLALPVLAYHHHDHDVHAYVARSDPNMGVRTGAKLSYFVDPEWERTRSASARCIHVNGGFDKTGSLIHRLGTLNGIATAYDAYVHVAGGYIHRGWTQVPLFIGRSCAPARFPRVGPDYVLPCDESVRSAGHTRRRHQKRQRVSPDRHQHRGTATGATRCGSPDPAGKQHPRAPKSRRRNGAAAIWTRHSGHVWCEA